MENLASKGPPMKNLVCNEKFGINCASAEAQFGTGRGINDKMAYLFKDMILVCVLLRFKKLLNMIERK